MKKEIKQIAKKNTMILENNKTRVILSGDQFPERYEELGEAVRCCFGVEVILSGEDEVSYVDILAEDMDCYNNEGEICGRVDVEKTKRYYADDLSSIEDPREWEFDHFMCQYWTNRGYAIETS